MFVQLMILLVLVFLLLKPLVWVGTRLSSRTEMNDGSSDEDDDHQLPPVYLPPPPAKGILKKTSSIEVGETSQQKPPPEPETKKKKKKKEVERKKSARFDEMNIIATLHPADKEYGHDTIDEPKTPFSWDLDEGSSASTAESVSACDLAAKLLQLSSTMPTVVENPAVRNHNNSSSTSINEDLSDVDEDKLTEEEKKKKAAFELRRKAHYDEFKVVKKMPLNDESDMEGDDDEGKKKRKKKGK